MEKTLEVILAGCLIGIFSCDEKGSSNSVKCNNLAVPRGQVVLSNNLSIPPHKVRGFREIEGGKIYWVSVGFHPEEDLIIIDKNDGRPYIVEDGEKIFDMTYEHQGFDYPLWEPTSSHPYFEENK